MLKDSMGNGIAWSDRELRQRQARETQLELDQARANATPHKSTGMSLVPRLSVPNSFMPAPRRKRETEMETVKVPLPAAPEQVKPGHVMHKTLASLAAFDGIRGRKKEWRQASPGFRSHRLATRQARANGHFTNPLRRW